jgi:hypothetical protein
LRGQFITDKTYYRWRREYGGLKVDQAKRMKELEAENSVKHEDGHFSPAEVRQGWLLQAALSRIARPVINLT